MASKKTPNRENALKILADWLTTGGTVDPETTAPSVGTVPATPTAANILAGIQSATATSAATTIITIPAGRTWEGQVTLSCDTSVAAASSTAGQALGIITVAGTGVTPAAGTYLACEARAGANVVAGLSGTQGANSVSIPLTVIAPAGNTVTIQLTSTQAGTASRVDGMASGRLL